MGRGFDENGTRRVSLLAKGWKKGFLRFWGLFRYSSIIMVDHENGLVGFINDILRNPYQQDERFSSLFQ